jgi:tRNA (guanine10-N2)-methyltransferase
MVVIFPEHVFQGPVNLRSPDVKVWLIILDTSGSVGLPKMPYRLVLAREIVQGNTARNKMQTFKLPKRRYLGPTSMDHELSFLMCNMAHVQHNDLVLDPFAGVPLRTRRSNCAACCAQSIYTQGGSFSKLLQ